MKQKDIALIIVIAVISGIVSLLLSTKIFVTPSNRQQEVEVLGTINNTFTPPSNKYFNKDSVNTETPIEIGANNNQNPFEGAAQ